MMITTASMAATNSRLWDLLGAPNTVYPSRRIGKIHITNLWLTKSKATKWIGLLHKYKPEHMYELWIYIHNTLCSKISAWLARLLSSCLWADAHRTGRSNVGDIWIPWTKPRKILVVEIPIATCHSAYNRSLIVRPSVRSCHVPNKDTNCQHRRRLIPPGSAPPYTGAVTCVSNTMASVLQDWVVGVVRGQWPARGKAKSFHILAPAWTSKSPPEPSAGRTNALWGLVCREDARVTGGLAPVCPAAAGVSGMPSKLSLVGLIPVSVVMPCAFSFPCKCIQCALMQRRLTVHYAFIGDSVLFLGTGSSVQPQGAERCIDYVRREIRTHLIDGQRWLFFNWQLCCLVQQPGHALATLWNATSKAIQDQD